MSSYYKRPLDKSWEEDSLVISNASEMIRTVQHIAQDVAVDVKILDEKAMLLNRKSNLKADSSSELLKRKYSSVESRDKEEDSSESDF